MTDRELRLRERIDVLSDERDELRAATRVLEARLSKALANPLVRDGVLVVAHGNQHGPCVRYETEVERREARRLSWRMSKRRAQERLAA